MNTNKCCQSFANITQPDKIKVHAESVNKTVERRGCDDLEVYTENKPKNLGVTHTNTLTFIK